MRTFVSEFLKNYKKLDILCNNAGVMMTPNQKTVDDFELQLGTNHLGHFALTGLLIETLMKSENSRIVTMSSFGHKMGTIKFQ